MPSLNKVMLMGNCTRDPQIKQLPTTNVADFGLAVNRKYKASDGSDREDVLFIDCAAFGRSAEVIAQYVTKGKPLFVEGRLKLDTWEDRSGGKRSKISLVVEGFQFIGDNRQGDAGNRSDAQEDDVPGTQDVAPVNRSRGATSKPNATEAGPEFTQEEIPF